MTASTNTDRQPDPLDTGYVLGLVDTALDAIAAAMTGAELKQIRIDHAGEKSPLALANRAIGQLEPGQRKHAGQLVGQARGRVNQALAARQAEVDAAELEATLLAERVDVTLPVDLHPVGALHPVTALLNDMSDVFIAMGWEVVEGPELESEWLNFDALNMPEVHPARGLTDTLFVDPPSDRKLLRTQTSPVQMRTLLSRDVPIYMVSPGKVFRADEYDATHLPMFHQMEGLAVDKGIHLGHLKGTLDHLARAMFGDVRTRLRPHYFPFTEPSAELDLWFPDKKGGAGWLEWGGCGMVNPNVLKSAGLDPEVYTGFAFGVGVERTLLLRHDINDMHDLVEGDVRFSEQFVMGE